MNIIIKIVGNANFNNDFIVKFCDSGFRSLIVLALRFFSVKYKPLCRIAKFN